jgi:hypothetical protein
MTTPFINVLPTSCHCVNRKFDHKASLNNLRNVLGGTPSIGEDQHKATKKPTMLIGSFALFLAVSTGVEFATRNYLNA